MGVRGKSLDSGPPSAVFPNSQHRHASTLSAAPCPSTLLVSDPFSFSCNPIWTVPVLSFSEPWGSLPAGPVTLPRREGCGGGEGSPASQKGHTQTQLDKSERAKRERGLKAATPDTMTGGSGAWLCLGKLSPGFGNPQPRFKSALQLCAE